MAPSLARLHCRRLTSRIPSIACRGEMSSMYWSRMLNLRLARRRFLAATGATGAAVLVAACGGDSSEPQHPASGLLYTPVDTSKSAKRGGVFRGSRTNEPLNFDLH